MKNFILKATALCGLFFGIGKVFAQKGFQIGIRYGVQESALFNKSDKNAGSTIQRVNTPSLLNGGLAFSYNFCKSMGIELDVLRSREGQEYSGMNTPNGTGTAYNHQVAIQAELNNSQTLGEYQAKAELNGIKIPLLLNFMTPNNKPVFYTFSVGPQLFLLNDAVYEYNDEDIELPGSNIEPTDAYKKATIEGVAAIGLGLNLSRHFLISAQARIDYGFQDIEKKDVMYNNSSLQQSYYPSGRPSTHTGTAGLFVGLSYKL